MNPTDQVPYSASVRLELLVDGRRIPLSHVGDNYAILRDLEEAEIGAPAVLIMNVDGREHMLEIVLVHGIAPIDRVFRYEIIRSPGRSGPLHPRLRIDVA
jgi:hypothetical protein